MFVPKQPLNLGQQQIQVAQLLSEELPDLIYNTLPFPKSTSAWHPKHLNFGNLKSKKWGGQQSRRQSHLSVTKHNRRRQTLIFSLCVPLSSTYLRSKQQRLLSSTRNISFFSYEDIPLVSILLLGSEQNKPKFSKETGKKQTWTIDQKQIHTVNQLGYSFEFYSRENNICRKNRPVSRLPLNIMQKSNVSQPIHQMQDLNIPTSLCHLSNKSGVRITLINSLSFFGLDF